jgi:hypothetical protein
VEALIAEYQSNAPPETMEKIAVMLSDTERPRVTRFMRAAVHAPNPKIQRTANEYLTRFAPKSKPARSSTSCTVILSIDFSCISATSALLQ